METRITTPVTVYKSEQDLRFFQKSPHEEIGATNSDVKVNVFPISWNQDGPTILVRPFTENGTIDSASVQNSTDSLTQMLERKGSMSAKDIYEWGFDAYEHNPNGFRAGVGGFRKVVDGGFTNSKPTSQFEPFKLSYVQERDGCNRYTYSPTLQKVENTPDGPVAELQSQFVGQVSTPSDDPTIKFSIQEIASSVKKIFLTMAGKATPEVILQGLKTEGYVPLNIIVTN